MRKRLLIFSPVVLVGVLLGTYFAGLWRLTPTPTSPEQLARLKDQYLKIHPADGKTDTRFAMFADVHHGYGLVENIVAEIEKDGNYDFMTCAGDMVSKCRGADYDLFAKSILRNQRKTPQIFVPGNHDAGKVKDRDLYNKFFGATHYKFSVGKNLFVSIDNATDEVFNDEYAWLESVLKAERDKYDNLIVFMHVPPVDMRAGAEWHAMPQEDGDKLLGLLKQYHATAIFCGHIHAYEEWKKDGVPIYVSGGSGGRLADGGYHHYLEVLIHDGKVTVTIHRINQ
jgi:Icc-related predicted phosphoesterase